VDAFEDEARFIETILMPAYSPENAKYDGDTVSRAEVYEEMAKIVARLRAKSGQLRPADNWDDGGLFP
jgi:hypothetical protein